MVSVTAPSCETFAMLIGMVYGGPSFCNSDAGTVSRICAPGAGAFDAGVTASTGTTLGFAGFPVVAVAGFAAGGGVAGGFTGGAPGGGIGGAVGGFVWGTPGGVISGVAGAGIAPVGFVGLPVGTGAGGGACEIRPGALDAPRLLA